ncbi:hypothetical protein BZA05DRAFT_186404 [Tricharina praecox]|uniref:uncharacterized protein n=1 Tax=Tricharina praecox TaxID=43433 RepID=UPI00221E5448|nr:uncharacterized protein BZA05DRAFT_186404 [Tricharina praecox]KAI5843147.1 hypothetical protein BZA05DRAFT_186404 [Tricharina praecox]
MSRHQSLHRLRMASPATAATTVGFWRRGGTAAAAGHHRHHRQLRGDEPITSWGLPDTYCRSRPTPHHTPHTTPHTTYHTEHGMEHRLSYTQRYRAPRTFLFCLSFRSFYPPPLSLRCLFLHHGLSIATLPSRLRIHIYPFWIHHTTLPRTVPPLNNA